jgi:circadian clock protein KaiB
VEQNQNDTTADFESYLDENSAQERYVLRLYVTGIDIYQQPMLAKGEQIIAAPTLIKKLPKPLRRIVGDLSNRERVLLGLDLRQAPSQAE